MKRKELALIFILAFLFSAVAETLTITNVGSADSDADDWPMFHHDPAHTGYTANTAAINPVKLWSYPEGHFTGYFIESSAAVVNGIVYVGSNWNYREGYNGGNIFAFNAYTGARIWNYSTQSSIHSSPAVSENRVLIGASFGILALDALTGAKLWNFATGGRVDSSPAVVDGIVYVGSQDGNVYALNASTGTKIWNYTTQNEVNSSPAVVSGVVYIGSDDNNVYALNASTGINIWTYSTKGNVASSPAVSNGIVYVGSGDGYVYALNALAGEKVWSFETYHRSQGYGIVASPAVADGVIYVASDGGGLYALNAATGAKLWNNYSDAFLEYSSAAIANGVIYISNSAINASKGTEIWAFPTGNVVYSSPAVVDGVVYIGSTDGNFYAIGEPLTMPSPNPSSFPINWLVTATAILAVSVIALLVYFKKRKH